MTESPLHSRQFEGRQSPAGAAHKTSHGSPPPASNLGGRRATTAPAGVRKDQGRQQALPELGFHPQYYEHPDGYCRGGHHPVAIGDLLSGRYEVVNKLGDGGFGLVWLCYDQKTRYWRAVKIVKARGSSKDSEELRFWEQFKNEPEHPSLSPPLDHFWLQGPNGVHLCLVQKLLGPHIQQVLKERDLKWMRNQFLSAAHALQYLHSRGICHGDFTIANILHRLEGFDFLTRKEVLRILGEPQMDSFKSITGEDPRPGQPKYLVRKVSSSLFDEFIVPGDVVVVDFGAAFSTSDPPEYASVPMFHRAPELFFGLRPSPASDVWALASDMMVLYGAYYFGEKESQPAGDYDIILEDMERCLGPLPQKFRGRYNTIHKILDDPTAPIQQNQLFCLGNRDKQKVQAWWRGEARRTRFNDPFMGRLAESLGCYYMEDSELGGFIDLLRNMFNMDPASRFSIENVLDHDWFRPIRPPVCPQLRRPLSPRTSSPFLSKPCQEQPVIIYQPEEPVQAWNPKAPHDAAPWRPMFNPGAKRETYPSAICLTQDVRWSDRDTAAPQAPSVFKQDPFRLPMHNNVCTCPQERPLLDRRDICLFVIGVAFTATVVLLFLLCLALFGPGGTMRTSDSGSWNMTIHLAQPPLVTSLVNTELIK